MRGRGAQARHEGDAAGVVLVAWVVQAASVPAVGNYIPRLRAFSERAHGGCETRTIRRTFKPAHGLAPSVPETITVLSQKGGTGKTTTVRTLADAYRRAASRCSRGPGPAGEPVRLLRRARRTPRPPWPTCWPARRRPPTRSTTTSCPPTWAWPRPSWCWRGKMGRELTLKRALRDLSRRYDLILVDCPPSLGLLTVNALVAADHALISSEARVLLAPGRGAGAGGGGAGEGVAPPRPRLARRGAEHRRHAAGALARGAERAAGAVRRRRSSRR